MAPCPPRVCRHCQRNLFRRFHAYSGTFGNIKSCSSMLSEIKAYRGKFRYYWVILSYIQTYSELCVNFAYATVPGITLAYLEPKLFSKSLFKNIQECLGIFRNVDAYSTTIRHFSFCKMLHLTCLTMFKIRLFLDNCLVISTVTLCYVLHQTHSDSGIFRTIETIHLFRYIQVYSSIVSIIKVYSGIIKVYLRLFRPIQNPLYFYHFCNLTIFQALAYLNVEGYSRHSETLAMHIQNSVTVRTVYQAFSSHIQAYSEPCLTHASAETRHI